MTGDPSIHRLELPTPFAVGSVNAYLIEDEPLTLVDPGPAWARSLDALETALAEHNRSVEEIELVLVTHQHLDHLGLVPTIVRRARAEVACSRGVAEYAADFDASLDDDDARAARLMRRHGVSNDVVEALRLATRVNRNWGGSFRPERALEDGDLLVFRDRTLRVVAAPGHSPTDTLFVDEERRLAIVGDHLLQHISSNALVASRPPGMPSAERYPALRTYIDSLNRTRELGVAVLLPGHGALVHDFGALIDERLDHHEQRAAAILEIIGAGGRSAHEIARRLWGRAAVQQPYLTTSEVLGHIDLLLDLGLVVEVEEDGLTFFGPVRS